MPHSKTNGMVRKKAHIGELGERKLHVCTHACDCGRLAAREILGGRDAVQEALLITAVTVQVSVLLLYTEQLSPKQLV